MLLLPLHQELQAPSLKQLAFPPNKKLRFLKLSIFLAKFKLEFVLSKNCLSIEHLLWKTDNYPLALPYLSDFVLVLLSP